MLSHVTNRLRMCVSVPRQLGRDSGAGRRVRCRVKSASECAAWRGGDQTVVLGVETSCDDTGIALMTGSGQLLGSSLISQTDVHKE